MSSYNLRWKIGFAVVGFWLLMMGILLSRELGGRFFPSTPAGLRGDGGRLAAPRETQMGLFLDGQRVGHVRVRQISQERQDLPGVAMELDARAALKVLGRATNVELTGSVWRPYEAASAVFEFAVRSADRGAGPYDFRIAGELEDGWLEAEVVSAGESVPLRIPVDEELIFASGFGPALELPLLAVGETVRLESFDPLTLQKSPMRVRCQAQEALQIGGASVMTRRLEVTAGGIRSQVWIDEVGDVVQLQTPFGLMLRRVVEPVIDTVPAGGAQGPELLGFTAIRPRGARPFRGARESVLRIVSTTPRPLPTDRVQVALGEDTYRLTTPPEPRADRSEKRSDLGPYLAADAFVQSDHPRIRRQAAAIVGEEEDLWRRAVKIHQWVYRELEKEIVMSIPSALEVLEKRRGDCNEHTVLFAALARAAALPTRIAIGLVWSDELEGFYYHAWPEVHIGDWVWMDPTLDQPLADATHLKLLNGGIERWSGLLPYLGQLEIEILEIH